MDGAQANAGAGTGSPGTGLGIVTLDDSSNLLNWDVSWSGLTGSPTLQHFHGPAAPGANAGVEVGIGVASNPAIGSATISATQATDLLNELWYAHLHTSTSSGGEIRGQVRLVPEPATIGLFGMAAMGLVGFVLHRRRKLNK